MKTITINNFGGGMTNSPYGANLGEFTSSRNFDILTFPKKLYPLASMASATGSTAIGNIIVGSDGTVYGVGNDGGPNVTIWKNTGGSTWTQVASVGMTGSTEYGLLCEYKIVGANSGAPDNSGGTKFLIYASQNNTTTLVCGNPNNNTSNKIADLTHVAGSIGQGFVHPTDKILYIPYKENTTPATKIGSYNGSTWNATALTLPPQYTITSLTYYGNYLAVACTMYSTGVVPGSSVLTSCVFLWDRVATTWNENIQWGDDSLQVLNNLNGTLVGISSVQDDDNMTLLVKGYAGGEVLPIRDISAVKQTTTSPTLTINPRVNFIHRNRLYFSADLKGGSTSPTQQGLWSVGKSKQGSWAVTVERFGSTDGTDVSVIAAAFRLGYLHVCHTTEGTLTTSDGISATLTTRYGSASVWESAVNPGMPDSDKGLNKQLNSISCHFIPLKTGQQIVVKYRVDTTGSWVTVFTKTATSPDTNLVYYNSPKPSSGQFRKGFNYEFRIESTGGAECTLFNYEYNPLTT